MAMYAALLGMGATMPAKRKLPDPGRFSDPTLLILVSLAGGPAHGYAMTEDIAGFSGTRFQPGTLYGALDRLERRGWIVALEADERRHPYRLTNAGADALQAQLATVERVVSVGLRRMSAEPGMERDEQEQLSNRASEPLPEP